MTPRVRAFIDANAQSPVVYASVITRARRRDRSAEIPKPLGCHYRLDDGQTFRLTVKECRSVGHPRWLFERAG